MSKPRGLIIPELLILQNVSHSLFRSTSATVKQLTLDIINRMEHPILLCDCHGHFMFYNESFAAFCPKDGKIVFTNLDLTGTELNTILDMGIPVVNFRDELVADGGQKKPVLLNIYPLPVEHERRMGSVVLATDMTKELATETYRELVSFILDTIPLGLLGINPNGDIMVCNQPARALLGMGDIILEGKPVDLITRNIEGHLRNLFASLVEEGKPHQVVPIRWDIDYQHFAIQTLPLPKNSGRLFVFRNETSYKQIKRPEQHKQTTMPAKVPPKAADKMLNLLTT
ncbi:MAG: PAS domain-containing protein, partial [Desulfomonilaceae bacterium]